MLDIITIVLTHIKFTYSSPLTICILHILCGSCCYIQVFNYYINSSSGLISMAFMNRCPCYRGAISDRFDCISKQEATS